MGLLWHYEALYAMALWSASMRAFGFVSTVFSNYNICMRGINNIYARAYKCGRGFKFPKSGDKSAPICRIMADGATLVMI